LLEKLGIEWYGIALEPKPDSLYNLITKESKEKEYFIDIEITKILKKLLVRLSQSTLFT
jgi:hypothetical protein